MRSIDSIPQYVRSVRFLSLPKKAELKRVPATLDLAALLDKNPPPRPMRRSQTQPAPAEPRVPARRIFTSLSFELNKHQTPMDIGLDELEPAY